MFRLIGWTDVIVLSVIIHIGEGDRYSNLDKKCENADDCSSSSRDPEVVCKDGYCDCNSPKYIRHVNGFFDRTEVECRSITSTYLTIGDPFLTPSDFVCEAQIGRRKYCKCKMGIYTTFLTRSTCASENVVGFGELCRHFTNRCNRTSQLECTGSKCVCYKDEMYNFTSSKCEPKRDYLSQFGITEYRVTFGIYCTNSSDCIEGLECSSELKCTCPSSCIYNYKKAACDCGEVPAPVGPIIVGVLVGLAIVLCWCCMIRHTYRSHTKERSNFSMSTGADSTQPSAPDFTSLPPPHATPLLHEGSGGGLHSVRSQERERARFSTPVPDHIPADQVQPPPYYSLPDIAPPAYEDCLSTPLSTGDNRTSHC